MNIQMRNCAVRVSIDVIRATIFIQNQGRKIFRPKYVLRFAFRETRPIFYDVEYILLHDTWGADSYNVADRILKFFTPLFLSLIVYPYRILWEWPIISILSVVLLLSSKLNYIYIYITKYSGLNNVSTEAIWEGALSGYTTLESEDFPVELVTNTTIGFHPGPQFLSTTF